MKARSIIAIIIISVLVLAFATAIIWPKIKKVNEDSAYAKQQNDEIERNLQRNTEYEKIVGHLRIADRVSNLALGLSTDHIYDLGIYDCTNYSRELVSQLKQSDIVQPNGVNAKCVYGVVHFVSLGGPRNLTAEYESSINHEWVEFNDTVENRWVEATSGQLLPPGSTSIGGDNGILSIRYEPGLYHVRDPSAPNFKSYKDYIRYDSPEFKSLYNLVLNSDGCIIDIVPKYSRATSEKNPFESFSPPSTTPVPTQTEPFIDTPILT